MVQWPFKPNEDFQLDFLLTITMKSDHEQLWAFKLLYWELLGPVSARICRLLWQEEHNMSQTKSNILNKESHTTVQSWNNLKVLSCSDCCCCPTSRSRKVKNAEHRPKTSNETMLRETKDFVSYFAAFTLVWVAGRPIVCDTVVVCFSFYRVLVYRISLP